MLQTLKSIHQQGRIANVLDNHETNHAMTADFEISSILPLSRRSLAQPVLANTQAWSQESSEKRAEYGLASNRHQDILMANLAFDTHFGSKAPLSIFYVPNISFFMELASFSVTHRYRRSTIYLWNNDCVGETNVLVLEAQDLADPGIVQYTKISLANRPQPLSQLRPRCLNARARL